MPVMLFLLSIIVSFVIVRLGAAALELTGIAPSQARFQALSAFSGSGFTTRESELVVGHPARRKVVSYLMVFGNAGIITMMATLAGTIGAEAGTIDSYLRVGTLIVLIIILYRVAQTKIMGRQIARLLKALLVRQGYVQQVSFEEMMLSGQGLGVSQIEITGDNPLLGKSLAESGLTQRDILVLMIEREGKTIVAPKGQASAQLGDRFTCFGPLRAIREMAVAADERDAPVAEAEEG